MKTPIAVLVSLVVAITSAPGLAQTSGVPVPSPFPGAPAAPSTPRTQPATPPPSAAPAPVAAPDLPGTPPVYPTADYLDAIDAGSGQRYYLYGTNAPYSEIVSYYRTVTKSGGREIYRSPGTYQFDLGRFNDERMAYPPSVVVKDYSASTPAGYLHVSGTNETRYRTIIQIVPPGVQ